jgi:hypothetical protein
MLTIGGHEVIVKERWAAGAAEQRFHAGFTRRVRD